ncbi:MAG: amino acid ABC transporter permease [Proteobacteria bacterium]|nr:amino acid ABC transporter permease [Pseudomonadota bacterium]
MTQWERFVFTFFNQEVIARYLPSIAKGFVVTIEVAVLVVACGLALGLVLALVRSFQLRAVNAAIVAYADVLRAMPPLVLLTLVYFGLPTVGLTFSGFVSTWLTLTLVLSAFAEEIFWAGITSVPKGQWEAARSTGLGFGQALISVVFPQAVRLTIPPLTNRTIALTKMTALGTVVGLGEIINQATTAQAFSGNASPLVVGAFAYVILFLPVVVLARWIETRFAWRRQ